MANEMSDHSVRLLPLFHPPPGGGEEVCSHVSSTLRAMYEAFHGSTNVVRAASTPTPEPVTILPVAGSW